MTALLIAASVLAGIALMVATGVLEYRYETFRDSPQATKACFAFLSMLVFPIMLPFLVVLWIGSAPERRRAAELQHAADLRELEREVFG